MAVPVLKDICWYILPYVQMEKVIVNVINVTVENKHFLKNTVPLTLQLVITDLKMIISFQF